MGTTNLRKGSDGDEVTALQEGLRKLGYQVEVDGKFGPRTEEAVKSLQGLFGYTVDGIAGEGTQRLVEQQVGYGWSLNIPNAKEIAMRSQNGGKDTSQQMPGKPMQGDANGKPQGQPMRGQPMQGQPMQGKPYGQPQQGDPWAQSQQQGKPYGQDQQQGKPCGQDQQQGKPYGQDQQQGKPYPQQTQQQGKPQQQDATSPQGKPQGKPFPQGKSNDNMGAPRK